MSKINSNEIGIQHFLKADTYNEEYDVKRSDGGSKDTKIINGNDEFFNRVMLKPSEQKSNKFYIELIGKPDESRKVFSYELDSWIEKNIINSKNDMLIYVEGYAGCGKTTWVQSILYEYQNSYSYFGNNNDISDSFKENCKNAYIDFYKSFNPGKEYSADVIRYNIINSIVIRMLNSLKLEKGNEILENFCTLLNNDNLYLLSSRLPNIVKPFKKDYFDKNSGERVITYFYKHGMLLKTNSESEQNFIDVFRENVNEKDNITSEYLFSTFDISCLDYIWRIAEYQHKNNNSDLEFACYDNLDIIEDSLALARFIGDLETLKTNINTFRESYNGNFIIPYFKIFTTCRKITSSRLRRNGLVLPSEKINRESIKNDSNEASERDQRRSNILKIEVSNLFSYEKMIKKRANYFKKNISVILDYNDSKKLEKLLQNIIALPDNCLKEINYAELWNNNFRACNNVLGKIISDYPQYYKMVIKEYNKQVDYKTDDVINANTSILLHMIIKVLNATKEWERSLGYKDNKLTTMSRLILTYIYNKNETFVSLKDIINDLSKVNLDVDDNPCNELKNIYYICFTLQNMLTRLPNETEEIWRRPIFYKDNALLCKNENIGKELIQEYELSNLNKYTSFVISDEGSTFIESIVPQYEFYSARINKNSIPLFCIKNGNDLRSNLDAVYSKVLQCCNYQLIFMNRYIQEYSISILEYLDLDFHPITIGGNKQLHIVRVIFSHIAFFNSFRDYLFKYDAKRFLLFNTIIVEYIIKYLKLYEEKFYNVLSNTNGKYNNEVWNEIVLKCNNVINEINIGGKSRYSTSIRRDKDKEQNEMIDKQDILKYKYSSN